MPHMKLLLPLIAILLVTTSCKKLLNDDIYLNNQTNKINQSHVQQIALRSSNITEFINTVYNSESVLPSMYGIDIGACYLAKRKYPNFTDALLFPEYCNAKKGDLYTYTNFNIKNQEDLFQVCEINGKIDAVRLNSLEIRTSPRTYGYDNEVTYMNNNGFNKYIADNNLYSLSSSDNNFSIKPPPAYYHSKVLRFILVSNYTNQSNNSIELDFSKLKVTIENKTYNAELKSIEVRDQQSNTTTKTLYWKNYDRNIFTQIPSMSKIILNPNQGALGQIEVTVFGSSAQPSDIQEISLPGHKFTNFHKKNNYEIFKKKAQIDDYGYVTPPYNIKRGH